MENKKGDLRWGENMLERFLIFSHKKRKKDSARYSSTYQWLDIPDILARAVV